MLFKDNCTREADRASWCMYMYVRHFGRPAATVDLEKRRKTSATSNRFIQGNQRALYARPQELE